MILVIVYFMCVCGVRGGFVCGRAWTVEALVDLLSKEIYRFDIVSFEFIQAARLWVYFYFTI